MKIKITMRHCYSPVLLENFKNSRHHSKIWRKCLFTCYKWKGKMVHRFCSIIWLYIEISKGNFTLPKSALSPSKPSSVPREISLLPGKGARDWGKHPRSPNVLLTFRALSKGYFLSCFTENWKKKLEFRDLGHLAQREPSYFPQPVQFYEVQIQQMNEDFSLGKRDYLSLNPISPAFQYTSQRAGFLTSHRTLKEVTYSDTRGSKRLWVSERKWKIRHLGQLTTKNKNL